ncbi:c-type cytochrome [Rapidithrix thailandica]|uniref:C-type cytochrome n=1 Tax=Rapidithrix thailandica TaxID=413964 RepID=A0AAW9RZU2_9BACT
MKACRRVLCRNLYVLFISLFLFAQPLWAQETSEDAAQTTEAADAGSGDGIPADAAVISKGKEIFDGNCAQCHSVHEKVVGPALKNVYERKDVAWLTNFIKYPQKVIDSGDAYAQALFKEYKQIMPNHDFLSDEDIMSILAYVKDETVKGPAVAETPASSTGGDVAADQNAVDPNLLLAVIAGLVLLLVILLIAMVMLIAMLTRYLKQKEDLSEEDKEFISQRFQLKNLLQSQGFIGVVSFVFLAVVLKATVDGLFSIGVQQGYAPEQPIPFSHKLHAGYYEIDCKYCHTGVEKSKNANIPSANICMNCHNTIRTTSPNIQKIYAAIENDEPIQWVRVHNLPDLAYFNHSQHVKVAGLECEQCHGDVKEMEVVQQFSLLTMGWCIDCHRKTEVNTEGNAYYDKLVELHSKNSKDPMTVEDIGGLECAKCHY